MHNAQAYINKSGFRIFNPLLPCTLRTQIWLPEVCKCAGAHKKSASAKLFNHIYKRYIDLY